MAMRLLADVAFARAGDKGDISDVTVFAPTREVYDILVEQVTTQRVKQCYGELVRGPVERYEVPNIFALKFVMHDALGGGGPSSLRADNLGKAMGGPILRLPIDVPDELNESIGSTQHPPTNPYAGHEWVVD